MLEHSKYSPIGRLFAFLFDVTLFSFPFELAWILMDKSAYLTFSSSTLGLPLEMARSVTALPLLALCVFLLGNSPGKALLGFLIYYREDAKKSFTKSYQRVMYSYWLGIGAQLYMIMFFTLFWGYQRIASTGYSSWDSRFGTHIVHKGFSGVRVAVFVLLLIAMGFIKSYLLYNDIIAMALETFGTV